MYTDFGLCFLHDPCIYSIWWERILLTALNTSSKRGPDISVVLEAIWLPTQVATIYFKAYQKDHSHMSWGKNQADQQVKQAARLLLQAVLFPNLILPCLQYAPQKTQKALDHDFIATAQEWLQSPKDKLLLVNCAGSLS